MKKRKLLSLFLAFCLVLGLLPATALAAYPEASGAGFKLVTDSYTDGVLTVTGQVKLPTADGISSFNVLLSYDSTKLTLLKKNDNNTKYTPTETKTTYKLAVAALLTNGETEEKFGVSEADLYGKDGRAGFKINLYSDGGSIASEKTTDWVSAFTLKFEVNGKPADAATVLDSDSLRIADPVKDAVVIKGAFPANNNYCIQVTDAATPAKIYSFGKMAENTDAETADNNFIMSAEGNNTATYPGSTNLPAYSGEIAAPTVSENKAGKVTLNDAVITPADSSATVQYGYSTAGDGTGITWQSSKVFTSLTIGGEYYFYAKVVGTSSYSEKISAASSKVTVADKELQSIAIEGDSSVAVPTKGNTATISDLTVKATYDDSSSNVVASGITWSLNSSYAGVSVNTSNGVVTIQPSAAAGTVTVKAEYGGKEAIHSITLTKADAGTLAAMTISGDASVSVPGEYTYNVTGEDKYGASVTPGSVTWSIEGTEPTGVSIGSSDGKLKIENTASEGSVTIKATSGTVSDTKIVTITKAASVVSSVTISGGVSSLTVPTVSAIGGEASTNAGTAFSAELKDQYGAIISGTVTWSVTGNPGVTISDTGLLTITNEATGDSVTVKATCDGKEDTKNVTVTKATPEATFIQICKGGSAVPTDSITIPTSGDTTVNYTAEVYDQYGKEFTTDTPTWDITSATGVFVTGGAVKVENTASEGSVTLTATSSTKSTLKVEVTITLSNKPAHNIGTFADANKTITYGDSYAGQTVSSTTGTVKYSSSDSSAVSVNESTGALTIHKATSGAVTITATVEETSTYAEATASYTITVNKKELVITGLTATNRDYAAGSTTVALTGGELTGIVGEDDVSVTMPTSGTMTDANAGSGKAVTVTTPTLSGADKDNYTLKAISGITVTINKIDPDVGTVTKNSPSTIYTSTVLNSITLSKTGSAVGELKLTAGQTLTVGTAGYEWTFTPTDSTNFNTATGTVSLTVENDTLNSISIGSTKPSKTTYKYGETFETTGLTVTATYASGATKVLTSSEYTVTNGTMTMGQTSVTLSYQGQTCTVSGLTVNKADAPTGIQTAQNIGHKYSVSGAQMVAFPAGLPTDKGTTTYAVSDINNSNGVLTGTTTVDENGVVTYTLAGQSSYTAGLTASFKVTATMANYESVTVTYTITLTNKDTPVVEANDITVTYTGAEIPVSAITGTAKFGDADVLGSWSWKTTAPKNVADSSDSVTVVFTPTDAVNYETVEDTIKVTINKATPTGTPTYTAITTSGKTLGDAGLTIGSITPVGGSIAWDLGDSQTVSANTAYNWTYTPADTANYNNLTGSITPYVVSSSGGGGGVSTYAITISSAKNGDVTSSHKSAAKGTTVTLTVDPDKGYTLETITVTDGSGKEVKLTEKNGKYTFTMPASKVTVKATFMEDNSMLNFFVDVPANAYYYDAVLWAAENGITGGVDATHFAPNATCTRAQAVTFLWRAAGSPAPKSSENPFTDVKAGSYYYDAVLWAVENGITNGTSATAFSPNATCSRAQIVTFLWRSQKSPAADTVNPFADVAADSYYANAVVWAAENGITGGTSATTFSPNNNCTRAQIVTFLFRCLGE